MTRRPLPPGARDTRAVLWPAHHGAARAGSPPPRAAVVGGGIAGLTAAVALAERGIAVNLYERGPHLGGRLAGWDTTLADGTTVTMNRGFHAFFRQYYNLRALLRRIDPALGFLTALPDYPLRSRTGGTDRFAGLPRTPPWNALLFALRSPTFRLTDLARIDARRARPLFDVRVPDVYHALDTASAAEFLAAVNFPPKARHLAFEVFSRSFFSAPEALSAAELALMFHIYFLGSSEGLLFDVVNEPFPQALWNPLADRLAALSVRVHTATAVRAVAPRPDGGFDLDLDDGAEAFDAVVLATDLAGLRTLVERSPLLDDHELRACAAAVRQAPPFLVSRHWIDRPARPDRAGFLGTSGYGPLDNVSVVERWEGQAARWTARTGGSVLELHAYAVDPSADRTAVQDQALAQSRLLYPETATARVVDSRHAWHSDCPLFAVGSHAQRPRTRTRYPRLVLAGDAVRCPLPTALMERAATTGFAAANSLLRAWGLRGHDLWSVPPHGRNPLLRAFASGSHHP
ncbi:FAD-dependent oxidoreductase [Kitasatospora sp. NPDC058406]|uniref:FAD-dependent oxidoreductase n=1 Tax=Kitasatospora sp. NPDC058406 TaxID=3346483 RepID=UPI003657E9CE